MEIKVGKSHKEQDEYGNSKVLYGFLYGICKDPWFYIEYVWSYMICWSRVLLSLICGF